MKIFFEKGVGRCQIINSASISNPIFNMFFKNIFNRAATGTFIDMLRHYSNSIRNNVGPNYFKNKS